MALSESIRTDLSAVFDARVEAECLYRSLESIDPDMTVPMVYAFRCQIERIASACDALEMTLIQKVLPLVEDFEGVSKCTT